MKHDKDISLPQSPPAVNPCVLTIFGITGDLTKRLLFPAICNLGSRHLLNENFTIIGISNEKLSNTAFHKLLVKNINEFIKDAAAKKYALQLAAKTHYICGDVKAQKTYAELKKKLQSLENITRNVLFYLAVQPDFIPIIAKNLAGKSLLKEQKKEFYRRLIVEKPFGHDVKSARKLNHLLLSLMNESQIYRIDHFLGKETVQNLLAFRFSNSMFEPIWNRLYIDHVQITVAEQLGVENRGQYYEKAGALRDMVSSHIFQMLSLITMEPPCAFNEKEIHAEKQKALDSIKILTPAQVPLRVVRGQYDAGIINHKKVIAYRDAKNVAPNSLVETFVALKFYFNNWRWLNVPFYLRTGKCLPIRKTEIVVQFKKGPSALFTEKENNVMPNLLRLSIQPEEGISLRFNAKVPGVSLHLGQVDMRFHYSNYFGIKPETGYETILYDCLKGDHLLFTPAEMVETEWKLVQPILDMWSIIKPQDFPNYKAGTWGPEESEELITQDGRKWII